MTNAVPPREQRIPVPEPDLTRDMLIDRARALRDRIREEQDSSEKRGCHSPELEQEFVKAGFYRILQPRMFGGYEFDYVTFYRVMLEICRGNPGTGWCVTLGASHAPVVAALWPEEAQAEIFPADGHFVAPHRAGIPVPVKKVDGGYLVEGVWGYASGCPYSTHFIGTAVVENPGDGPENITFIVPRDRYDILDDWGGDNVLGMRASGSNSVRVQETVVPEHHVIPSAPGLWSAADISNGTYGTRLHGNPMYLARLMGPYHCSLVVPAIGAARAAIDEMEGIARARKTRFPPVTAWYENSDVQRNFGQAIMLTDAAEAMLIRASEMYMEKCQRWAEDGTDFSVEESARMWGMLQYAGNMACDAVDMMFRAASSSAARTGQRMERYYRDAAMYRSHTSSQIPTFAGGIGRLAFGLKMDMFGV